MSRVLGQTEQHVDPASSRLAVTGFVSTSVEVCVCLCVFGLGWEVGGMGVLEGRYKYLAFFFLYFSIRWLCLMLMFCVYMFCVYVQQKNIKV